MRGTQRHGRAIAGPFVVAMLLLGGPARAEGEGLEKAGHSARVAPAVAEFNLGIQAFDRSAYAEAYEHLRRSLELDPHFKTAAVLGQAALALERPAEAATWFAWTLLNMPSGEAPEVRLQIQTELDRLKQQAIEVTIQAAMLDTALTIDGNPWPLPVTNGTKVYLEPGKHELALIHDGRQLLVTQVEGVGGSTTVVTASPDTVEPRVAPLPPKAATVVPSIVHADGEVRHRADAHDPRAPAWLLPTAIVTSAATLGAVGLGSLWHRTASEADEDIASLATELRGQGPIPCDPSAPSTPTECQDLVARDQDRVWNANASTAAFVSAGVLAVASAGLWVWLWNSDSSRDVAVSYSSVSGVHQLLLRGSL